MRQDIKERIEQIQKGIVPEGYKKTMVGIIPEDWEVKYFKNVFKVSQGLQIPIKDRFTTPGKNRLIYITNEYINNLKRNRATIEYIEDAPNNVKCVESDILMTRTGNTGIVITNVCGVFHNNFFKIRLLQKMDKNFVIYYLNSNYIQFGIKKLAGSSTIPDLTHSDFYSLSMIIPPYPIQNKIASILETWDRAIELKEKLIQEKQTQKKGLIKQLLQLRENWIKIKLNDLGSTYTGLSGKTKEDFGQGKKFITYKNIFDNSEVDLEIYNRVNIEAGENQNEVKYGDVFFTTSSETPDEVGMSSVLLTYPEETYYLNSFCFGYRLNNFETVLPQFLKFYLRSDEFRRKIFSLAQGSTRFNLSKNELLKLKIEVPPITEQQRIAKILSTADREIELLKEEVELLKQQKKGLMQLLLTGIIRV